MTIPTTSQVVANTYNSAVQIYGADAVDKAAKESGIVDENTGHLNASNVTLPELSEFISDLQAGQLGNQNDVPSSQAEQLANVLSASMSGDTASFLARAMIQSYGQQRHENVLERMQDGMSAQQELMNGADQLDAEGDKMQSAAIVSLVTSVVSAAITIGTSTAGAVGGIRSIRSEMTAMRSEMQATKELGDIEALDKDVESAEKLGTVTPGLRGDIQREKNIVSQKLAEAQLERKTGELNQKKFEFQAQLGDSIGKIVSAAGEYYSKSADADIKHMDADAKRFEAEAQYYQTQGDIAKSKVEALQDMANQIITFVHDQQEAKSELMQAFTRG